MNDSRDLANLIRRTNRARQFPRFTCAASRHVNEIALALSQYGKSLMIENEPEFCAESMLAVVEALWQARARVAELEAKL